MRDLREYGKKHWRSIAVSAAAAILCFGFLACGGNIRIDTEELINQPGTTVGWLTIGRFSLVFFKRLLGLSTYRPVFSGVLFLVFFWLGANLLTYALYRFSGKREYPYAVFLLLYVTSNIWSFQVYFTLQQAEVALAMLLLVVAAALAVWACFARRGRHGGIPAPLRLCALAASAALLVAGLGAYQALAAYYIVICAVLFVVLLDSRDTVSEERAGRSGYLLPVCALAIHFAVSYAVYYVIANTWFMAASDYMESQMGWGRLPAVECVKNVLRTAKNIATGYGPRNFSFYTAGVILVLAAVPAMWKRAWRAGTKEARAKFIWRLIALAGIALAPFLMTIYMGEMLVTRSQFALPVSAAFFGMYGICGFRELCAKRCGSRDDTAGQSESHFGKRRAATEPAVQSESCAGKRGAAVEPGVQSESYFRKRKAAAEPVGQSESHFGKRKAAAEPGGQEADAGNRQDRGWVSRLHAVAWVCIIATIVIQCAYQLRLLRTDQLRYKQDIERTELLLAELTQANGGALPDVPVIFVGYQPAALSGICRRTEMYGWSFYEWDYSADNPAGATHRIAGFVQAYTGSRLDESATEEQRREAVALAAEMPDFPAEGSVRVTDDYVVVRLSEVVERTDNDWW